MFFVEHLIVLLGLFALAIPVVVHLLQRRHHETIDWGAMQFLPESERPGEQALARRNIADAAAHGDGRADRHRAGDADLDQRLARADHGAR